MKLNDLREQRETKMAELRALSTKEEAGETLADNERARFDTLETEVRTIDGSIRRAETARQLELRADATPVGECRDRLTVEGFSATRALRGFAAGKLDGIEGEWHAELAKGREVRGVMMPVEYFLGGGERRSQTVASDPAGGYLVTTTQDGVADRFRPALKVEALGARVVRGLVGDFELPNLTASGTAHWVGENGAPTRSAATFGKVSMTPRTVSAEYQMSRRFTLQTGPAIESILRADMGLLLSTKLDLAAINGVGAAVEPLGVLNAGIEKVTTEAYIGDTCANLIGALDLDDVVGTRAFLTNPAVLKLCRKQKDGHGLTIPMASIFHGEKVEVSTQVPTDIGSGANRDALIYGQWGELVIGYWSGVDILPNPYHSDVASSGGQLLHAFLDADTAVRHVEAFAYAEIDA